MTKPFHIPAHNETAEEVEWHDRYLERAEQRRLALEERMRERERDQRKG
jgi:hypothetical protein